MASAKKKFYGPEEETNLNPLAIFALASILLLTGCQAQLSLRSHSTPETQKPAPARGSMTAVAPVPAEDDKSSPACMCDPEALKQAVLERIWESGIGKIIYEYQQAPDAPTQVQLGTSQLKIDRLGHYRDNLKDHCLQDAYSYWVDFYQRQHDKAIESLGDLNASPKYKRDQEIKEREREVAECKRTGTVPRIGTP